MSRHSDQDRPRKLNLRLAEQADDLAALQPLLAEFHDESHFAGVPLSMEKIGAMFDEALARPDRFGVMIADYAETPIGFLYCFAGEYFGGHTALVTTIHSYYVSRRHRRSVLGARAATRLLKGAIRWSEQRQVREVILHVTSGIEIDRTDRFVRKAGFRMFGANYALRLTDPEAPQI